MNRKNTLMSASALIAASLAIAGAASATTAPTMIYGGGSSLIGPYLRQAEDCYGNQVPLVSQGTVLSGAGANETTKTLSYFNFAGPPAHSCSTAPVDATVTLNYIAAGSGNGIASFFSHDAKTFFGNTIPGTDPSPYASIQYGASDAGLAASDVHNYTAGGTEGSGGSAVFITAPGVAPLSGQTPPQYANPVALYGNLIQVPLIIAPVALAYSPTYSSTLNADGTTTAYSFHIKTKNADGSGGLRIDMATVCAIYNGAITNWNDPAFKALNGGVSLEDPTDPTLPASWSVPIEVVGRSDSSGTTSILYRALAAQCTGSDTTGGDSVSYTNQYAATGAKTLPATLEGPTWSSSAGYSATTGATHSVTAPTPGLITLAKGSSGVSQYVSLNHGAAPVAGVTYTQGQIGYVGTDYVLPAVANSGANHYGLNVVDVVVGGTHAIEPTAANALKAFGTGLSALVPPQSTSTGVYAAGNLGSGQRNAPQDWAEPISTTTTLSTGVVINTPLANPNVNISGVTVAYPIVGTTDGFFYTCYNAADANVTAKIKAFLTYYYTNVLVTKPKIGLLATNGFAAMPKAWATAINKTFLTTDSTTAPLNLNVVQAGTGPASGNGSQCNAVTPGA